MCLKQLVGKLGPIRAIPFRGILETSRLRRSLKVGGGQSAQLCLRCSMGAVMQNETPAIGQSGSLFRSFFLATASDVFAELDADIDAGQEQIDTHRDSGDS